MDQNLALRTADTAGGAWQNKLLAALPRQVWARVEPHLSAIHAQPGEILGQSHLPLDYAYFPLTSIVSIQYMTTDGATIEIAAVGSEGVVGVNLFLGGGAAANRLVIQNLGHIYRLRREVLQKEFSRGGAMQKLLLQYTQRLLAQIAQISVCNQRHSIDQQLSRWLVQTLDRLGSQEVMITHELLANTLGVRREGITESARKLHRAGIITYQRGRIVVIDPMKLKARCCECYAVMRYAHGGLTRLPSAARQIMMCPAADANPLAISNLQFADESPTPI